MAAADLEALEVQEAWEAAAVAAVEDLVEGQVEVAEVAAAAGLGAVAALRRHGTCRTTTAVDMCTRCTISRTRPRPSSPT